VQAPDALEHLPPHDVGACGRGGAGCVSAGDDDDVHVWADQGVDENVGVKQWTRRFLKT
jgi:hypothetical protein